jgi:hypothetical protein
MGLLAANQNALLGAAAEMEQACPDRITLQRPVITVGAMGGTSYDFSSPTIVARDVPANIQNVSPRESEGFSRRGITVSNKIFVPQGLDAKLGDRIPNPNVTGQYFVVTFISDMGGQHQAFKIYVNLVV